MIKEFNYNDVKVSYLRGDHYADTVYCKQVIKHSGDVNFAWLHCDELIEMNSIRDLDKSKVNPEDRIYTGELHIRGVYGVDECWSEETE